MTFIIISLCIKVSDQNQITSKDILVFFDVGSGDSTLLIHQELTLLIDGGPSNQIDWVISNHIPPFSCKLDYMLLTHAHSDHLYGLSRVFDRCSVFRVYQNNSGYDSILYKNWTGKTKNITYGLHYPDKLFMGDLVIYVLWPGKTSLNTKENNNSIVILIDHEEFEALLMGDLEKEMHHNIKDNLNKLSHVIDGGIDVYKVPHHGAANALDKEFLLWLQPKVAVISVGENSYGHPSSAHLLFLEELGTRVYRTDEYGSIIVNISQTASQQ